MERENNLKQQIAAFIAAVLITGAIGVALFGTPVHF
jgi:hypothetical protein